jgi:hypothetical protein
LPSLDDREGVMPQGRRRITVINCHVAGDLSRVAGGVLPPPPGRTIADQVRFLAFRADGLRRLLLSEPRCHPCRRRERSDHRDAWRREDDCAPTTAEPL